MSIKKASTLIISNALETRVNNFDYNIILLKRSEKMRAWPGALVFPGGKFDDSIDNSENWLKVFFNAEQFSIIQSNPGSLKNQFQGLFNNSLFGQNNFEIKRKLKMIIPYEIAYRLCAIRETFEETGILIAYEKDNSMNEKEKLDNQLTLPNSKLYTKVYEKNHDALKNWQKRVKNDPKNFLEMFLEMNLIPDIRGLHEWANWITPSFEKYRFDTVFFSCFIEKQIDKSLIHLDHDEIEDIKKYTPVESVKRFNNKEIKFIPPQFYELRRMSKFENFHALSQYSLDRQKNGIKPWLPKHCTDIKLGVLPGDHLYDSFIDQDPRSSNEILESSSSNEKSPQLKKNRVIRRSDNSFYVECNFDLDQLESKL